MLNISFLTADDKMREEWTVEKFISEIKSVDACISNLHAYRAHLLEDLEDKMPVGITIMDTKDY